MRAMFKLSALALFALAVPAAAATTSPLGVAFTPKGYAVINSHGTTIARSDALPALSTDGEVAVARRDHGLYRITIGGRVVATAPGPLAPALALSADGKHFAVGAGTSLSIVTRGSGATRRVKGNFSNPVFSPDGTTIAAVRTTGNGRAGTLRAELDVIPVSGGAVRRLYRVSDAYSFRPQAVFTPDGSAVAFLLDDAQVATVPVSGGKVTTLTAKKKNVTLSNLVALERRLRVRQDASLRRRRHLARRLHGEGPHA